MDVNRGRSLLLLSEFFKLIMTGKGVKTDSSADIDDFWSAEAAAVDPVEEDGRPGVERPAGEPDDVSGEGRMMSDEDASRSQWRSHGAETSNFVSAKSSSGK